MRTFNMEIIAWRGQSHTNLENTIAACVGANTDGFDRIEIDTRVTKDGVLIAFHSPTLRTWGLKRRAIDITFLQISQQKKHKGEWTYHIHPVQDIMHTAPAKYLLHVKRENTPQEYFTAFKQLKYIVDIHSNSEKHLRVLRHHPKVARVFKSVYTVQEEIVPWVQGYMIGHNACFSGSGLDHEFLHRLKDAGKTRYIFAGNTRSWLKEVMEFDVDGLLTARIDRVREIYDGH